jgi:hypothetical protein
MPILLLTISTLMFISFSGHHVSNASCSGQREDPITEDTNLPLHSHKTQESLTGIRKA